jgi:hypothetical protein
MAVKGSNFAARKARLVDAYFVASQTNDKARARLIVLAFHRLTDHTRPTKDQ